MTLLCKKIIRFVNIKDYWPTEQELFDKFHRGNNYTLSAIKRYSKLAQENGYVDKRHGHLSLTGKYFSEQHTEPFTPRLPDDPRARDAVKTALRAEKRAQKKLQTLITLSSN